MRPTKLAGLAAAKTAHAMALVVAGATATTDDDDFETLQRVEASLCEKLRRDEAGGFDLGDQLSKNWTWRSAASAQPGKGAHEYFAEDPGSPSLIARGFARWPEFVTRESRRLAASGTVQNAGLLPEIECAWAALGKTLVVWDYRRGDDVCVYEGLSDRVTCVCLAPPKPKVFVDAVRHVLAVATARDVALVALVFEKSHAEPRGRLRVVPTDFSAQIETKFTAASSTRDGRLFFAGGDGFVHELEYASRESVVSRVLRMGAPPPLESLPASGDKRKAPAPSDGFARAKCLRRDPSIARRVATSVLPPFARPDWLLHPLRFLGLEGSKADPIAKITVDDARGALYALSARGALDVYDLGREGQGLSHVGRCDVARAAKVWATAHSARDTTAPSPHLFDDKQRKGRALLDVHVVSALESSTIHAVCVDDAGFRFYFSTQSRATMTTATTTVASEDSLRPRALVLVHVRAPPPNQLWDEARKRLMASTLSPEAQEARAEPSRDAAEIYATTCGATFYSGGVLALARNAGADADRLLSSAVDARRGKAPTVTPTTKPTASGFFGGLSPTQQPVQQQRPAYTQAPQTLREAVAELADEAAAAPPPPRLVPRVWALAEACPRDDVAAKLRALHALSKTPARPPPFEDGPAKVDVLVLPLAARESDAFVATENRRRYGAAVEARHKKKTASASPADVWSETAEYRGDVCSQRPLHGGRHVRIDLPEPGLGVPRPRAYASKVAPLSELATQHIVGERRLIALTRLGVEELGRCRPADRFRALLASSLASGGRGGAAARSFRDAYGPVETCAMALSVAVGADAASGTAPDNASLRRAALAAYLDLGGRPSYREGAQQPPPPPPPAPAPAPAASGPFGAAAPAPAPQQVLQTYAPPQRPQLQFHHSPRHDALVLVASRLLRPAWFKACVWFDGAAAGPLAARAKFLLDRRDLTALRGPLTELRAALRDEPALAVATRHDLLAADRARRGLRSEDSNRLVDAQARDADAARVEALALHRVYRLLARAGEALALLDVLLRARDAEDRTNWAAAKDAPPPPPPKVPSLALVVIGATKKPVAPTPGTAVDAHLKALAGLTLRELVCSRKAHELVRGCLRALVAPASSDKVKPYAWPHDLARELGASCGLFFRGGDALAHAASLKLVRAETLARSARHAEADQEIKAASEGYVLAARAWRSPADVLPAAAGQVPALAAACNALRARNQGAAAVRCALACAANFTGDLSAESLGGDWEASLYRGTAPTTRDGSAALKACLDAAVDAVAGELRRCATMREHSDTDSADAALAACCAASASIRTAPDFLDRVLEAAREADPARLLALPLAAVEPFLRTRDPALLWRHHAGRGRHARAAALMEDLATQAGAKLDDRVGCLVRAADAARRACGAPQQDDEAPVCDAARVRDLDELLAVARLQQRCLRRARDLLHDARRQVAPDERARDLERVCQTLETRLVGVSELYNDVASRYGMWDVCLATLKVCGHDDEPLAVKLWTSLIKRLVPKNARDPELRRELASAPFWVAPGCTDAQEPFWVDDYDGDAGACFEDGAWRRPLRDAVAALGRELGADELGAPGASRGDDAPWTGPAFPLKAVAALLQRLATRAADADPSSDADAAAPKWPADCLLDSGAPRLALALALSGVSGDSNAQPLERLHALANAADVLDAWALKARDDARARAALAAGLRHGADPDALAAALRGFDGRGRGGPLVQHTLERLAATSERVEALFSR